MSNPNPICARCQYQDPPEGNADGGLMPFYWVHDDLGSSRQLCELCLGVEDASQCDYCEKWFARGLVTQEDGVDHCAGCTGEHNRLVAEAEDYDQVRAIRH